MNQNIEVSATVIALVGPSKVKTAKTRLNHMARDKLVQLAESVIKTPAETAALDAAYTAAANAISSDLRLKYPPKDMAVLAKYDAARRDQCIRATSGGAVFRFNFRELQEAPMVPGRDGCHTRLVEPETYRLVNEHEAAEKVEREAKRAILRDYHSLISAANTFEDVVAIWPEAESLRSKICVQSYALSVVTKDLADRIATDMAKRVSA